MRWRTGSTLTPPGERLLPDLCVAGTDASDWQALLDLIRERGWTCRYRDGPRPKPPPAEATVLLAAGQGDDLRELQGRERLNQLYQQAQQPWQRIAPAPRWQR